MDGWKSGPSGPRCSMKIDGLQPWWDVRRINVRRIDEMGSGSQQFKLFVAVAFGTNANAYLLSGDSRQGFFTDFGCGAPARLMRYGIQGPGALVVASAQRTHTARVDLSRTHERDLATAARLTVAKASGNGGAGKI